jgi:hypothetical protein
MNYLSGVHPTNDYLSDVASVLGVIIGISIPLGVEIVSRISERYDSDVVSRPYSRERINKYLSKYLVFIVIIAIGSNIFADNLSKSHIGLWQIFSGLILLSFIAGIVLFLSFVKKLNIYISNPEFVMDKLYKKVNDGLDNG